MSYRICAKCQKVLRVDEEVCSYCGTALSEETPGIVCKRCGKELAGDAKFCSGCGTAVPKEPEKLHCKHCGKELAADAKFCSGCGELVSPAGAGPKVTGGLGNMKVALTNFLKKYPKKTITRAFGLLGAAMVALIAVGLFLSGGDRKDQVQPPSDLDTGDPPAVSDDADDGAWRNNVLMENKVEEGLDWQTAHTGKVFGTDLTREEIGAVAFEDSFDDLPEEVLASESWDVSQAQDGSVRAFAYGEEAPYTLVIVGEGGVAAPADCSQMFAYFKNAFSIVFEEGFHTETATSMAEMFLDNENMVALIGEVDTSQVTDMHGMFRNCHSLEQLSVDYWETGKVTTMGAMFLGCSSLTELDMEGWDTSNVTSLSTMFYDCPALRSVKLSQWDTSNVANMVSMFHHCTGLTELDLSGWDFSKANTSGMFDDTNVDVILPSTDSSAGGSSDSSSSSSSGSSSGGQSATSTKDGQIAGVISQPKDDPSTIQTLSAYIGREPTYVSSNGDSRVVEYVRPAMLEAYCEWLTARGFIQYESKSGYTYYVHKNSPKGRSPGKNNYDIMITEFNERTRYERGIGVDIDTDVYSFGDLGYRYPDNSRVSLINGPRATDAYVLKNGVYSNAGDGKLSVASGQRSDMKMSTAYDAYRITAGRCTILVNNQKNNPQSYSASLFGEAKHSVDRFHIEKSDLKISLPYGQLETGSVYTLSDFIDNSSMDFELEFNFGSGVQKFSKKSATALTVRGLKIDRSGKTESLLYFYGAFEASEKTYTVEGLAAMPFNKEVSAEQWPESSSGSGSSGGVPVYDIPNSADNVKKRCTFTGCDGGLVDCRTCDGEGGWERYDHSTPDYSGSNPSRMEWKSCSTCGGDGKVDCDRCDGDGYMD